MRRTTASFEGTGMEQRRWRFVEKSLAVIFGGEPPGEPIRQAGGVPAVELQNGALFEVVADAIPIESCLAADMKPSKSPLKQDKAGVERQCFAGLAIDAACEAMEPARTNIVDCKVG